FKFLGSAFIPLARSSQNSTIMGAGMKRAPGGGTRYWQAGWTCGAKSPQFSSVPPGLTSPRATGPGHHLNAKGTLRHLRVNQLIDCRLRAPDPAVNWRVPRADQWLGLLWEVCHETRVCSSCRDHHHPSSDRHGPDVG